MSNVTRLRSMPPIPNQWVERFLDPDPVTLAELYQLYAEAGRDHRVFDHWVGLLMAMATSLLKDAAALRSFMERRS